MGQADGRRPVGVVRFGVGQPAELGRGEGGHRDQSHGVGPCPPARSLVAVAQVGDQLGGGVGRSDVVPQQRIPDDAALRVQADHAVLLPAHRQRGDVGQAPAMAAASSKACCHARGDTSVPAGCAARPARTRAPVSASRTITLHACVDVSTPATRVTGVPVRRWGAAASGDLSGLRARRTPNLATVPLGTGRGGHGSCFRVVPPLTSPSYRRRGAGACHYDGVAHTSASAGALLRHVRTGARAAAPSSWRSRERRETR